MAYESTETSNPLEPTVEEHEGHRITRGPDGSITVELPGALKARIPSKGDFDENLAETMDSSERKLLAHRLVEFCDVDRLSRKDWEEREKRALVMLMGDDAGNIEKKKEEQIGNNVTHPALMEATARFQANAITELFPPNGPLETKIVGKASPPKTARAARIRTFGNHYLTDVDKGYFDDTDKMLMYLPMGGSVFRKASQDFTTGLPILRHVKGTNFIAPYAGNDLASMPRYAHAFTMTGEDIDRAQQIGMFLDTTLPAPPMGEAKHAASADTSDARESSAVHETDKIYDVLEYHIDLELAADGKSGAPSLLGSSKRRRNDTGLRPYVVVVDVFNREVLLVRRNWRERDSKYKKRIWFAHHKFLPGLGFYGWGYPHVIGSLGNAASGAVNALLDSALMASFGGGFVSKEGKVSGELRLSPGVWKAVDSSAEDLAKSFFSPPKPTPMPALFQLLESLVGSVQRFSGTTDAAVGDGNNTGPVGTTVALIEQAQKPMSAIHKRLHVSFGEELQMWCELVRDYMPDTYSYDIGGEQQQLLKSDFATGVQVVPVTDPAVSSDTQRVMRAQAVLQLQKESPQLYPPEAQAAAHRRMLIALKVQNVDEVGPVVQQPKYLDPVSENGEMMVGRPVRVFPDQDDASHLVIHQDAVARAQTLFPPDVFAKVIQPAFQAHIRDHMAKSYVKRIMQAAGITPQFGPDGNPVGLDPRIEQQISTRVAQIIAKLPHPQPKPGTPSAEQQAADAKVQAFVAEQKQRLQQAEQAFQSEETRKQAAFDAEERRKDEALANQEARVDTLAATKMVREGQASQMDAAHTQDSHEQQLRHGEAEHVQDLTQGAQAHEHDLQGAQDAHDQGLVHTAEDHAQAADQGQQKHEQSLQQAEDVAKQAATVESEADVHHTEDGK